METTKHDLPNNIKIFFNQLSEYLDTKMLYFGSIQRTDYIVGKSDIDVDIFTDNEYSIISKMQHFLHVSKKEFKKIVWEIHSNVIYGYKLKYKNIADNINVEFSIYNEKFKQQILNEHIKKFVLPLHISCLLYILKIFYYQIPIIPNKTYSTLKRFILNKLFINDTSKFLVLE